MTDATDHPPGDVRCSVAAAARGDSMVATAPPAQTFLAVEVPGPWGANALRESRTPAAALQPLARRVASMGGRMVAVRRASRRASHGPESSSENERRWFWADCRPGHETLRTGTVADPEHLVDLRLDGTDGSRDDAALLLCCTHAKHDLCCAQEGRALVADLEAAAPGRVWESSHLGGCRFAPNVVVLPYGFYYGRVPAAAVPDLVAAASRGEAVRRHLRGRSALAAPAQGASLLVAERLGLATVDTIHVGRTVDVGPGRWQVAVTVDGVEMTAGVRMSGVGQPVELTCGAARLDRPPRWTLEHLATHAQ